MRDFLKNILATIFGLILFSVLGAGAIALLVLGARTRVDEIQVVEEKSVLVYDLSLFITDRPVETGLSLALDDTSDLISLRSLLMALEAAAADENIVALYLKGGQFEPGAGFATLQEIRRGIEAFKESGKPVIAYNVDWSEAEYYLGSVADTVITNPIGSITLDGLSAEVQFYAGALEKFGVGVQVVRVGNYKSAVEPFTQTQFSPQNREQTQRLLNDIWQVWSATVAESRSLDRQALQAITQTQGIVIAEAAAEQGLIDAMEYPDQVADRLRALVETDETDEADADTNGGNPDAADPDAATTATAADPKDTDSTDTDSTDTDATAAQAAKEADTTAADASETDISETDTSETDTTTQTAEADTNESEPDAIASEAESTLEADDVESEVELEVPTIDLTTYAQRQLDEDDEGCWENCVAIVYAEGEIVSGEASRGLVGSETYVDLLQDLREDEAVKAVVLRVDSPGGSATAAGLIGREVELLQAEKPVIVSMGNVAASGGYWIAAPAQRILAESTTITGSIGVFGLLPNFQTIANNNGITWDVVQTGPLANLYTIARPKSDAELAVLQRFVDDIYGRFLQIVADGRDLSPARVGELAQGRVWSGTSAQDNQLVDELGGLMQAVELAATAAQLDADWTVDEYPKQPSFEEEIIERLFGDFDLADYWLAPNDSQTLHPELAATFQQMQSDAQLLVRMGDPRGAYAQLPYRLRLR